MPRQSRLDFPGMLHHVMARGINRQDIFMDNDDRDDFLHRLSILCEDQAVILYAWALMPNHLHLLIRTGGRPLSRAMRSLLTGYAGAFNRRHRRSGHLFQNRYKSIVCEENVYFLELVRYLHLNPLRAGVVRDLAALDGYGYTGHSTLMGRTPRPWQNTREVLGRFSPRLGPARRAYRLFVSEGVVQGRRPDLIGGGLVRSVGGWKAVEELRRGREEYTSDERVLGGAEFVEDLMKRLEKEGDNKARLLKREPLEISHWVRKVCEATGVREEALSGPGRRSEVCLAREGLAYVWVEALGRSGRELAGVLNIRPESVYKAAKRGKEDRKRWEKMAGWN